ncbi:hypothetical protein [Ekhidna sp.]|uniref:hypothetical protein n=1 Tax=Ekhidna sp. TaxID=2608089 RepID=UPI0032EAE3EE
MKNHIHITLHFFILIFLGTISGCREEVIVVEEPSEEEVLSVDDITIQNVKRMLQMDGSFDNILDRSSCTSVGLPVGVVANNQEQTINDTSDFDLIFQIFDASEEDDDTLYFIFPITIIFADYSEQQVSNSDDFSQIINSCSNEVDDDIECIDFVYPVEISSYDKLSQQAKVIEFKDDRELYSYLDQLSEDFIYGFRYPLVLTRPDISTVTVNNNSQLNDAIVSADGTCDEDDDVLTKEERETHDLLISGIWGISLFEDVDDKTDDFAEYLLIFNEDGSVIAEINEVEIVGSWEVRYEESDSKLEVELEFDTDEEPIVLLNDEWVISSKTEVTIEMFSEGEEGDTEKQLTIDKI